MHIDIFNDDAFSAVTMTESLEDFAFRPSLIGSLNLFEFTPITSTDVSIELRENTLNIIPTTERGAPLPEGRRSGRNIRKFETVRIAKGHTLHAAEIQNVRAFGSTGDLETAVEYVGRYSRKLVEDVELTWEYQMLGAVQGVVLDADGTVLMDWFTEWQIPHPAEIDFELDTATTDVEAKCREVLRAMQRAAKGAWRANSWIMGLCGDSFFDKLTRHKTVREIYLNTQQAQSLSRGFGAADQSKFNAGSYAIFAFGGITFVNYRGVDSFDAQAVGDVEALGIEPTKCKFVPVNAPGVFQKAFAPGESFDWANTLGRELYQVMVRDKDRNQWVRPEVYSYPLFICTRPEMLLRAKENSAA